jgi:acyl carrier protein
MNRRCVPATIQGTAAKERPTVSTIERLQEVFRDVFDDDELTITPETTADDVEDWDSLQHVTLVVNVEAAFGVKFSSLEVAGLKNVGQLVALVEAKQS